MRLNEVTSDVKDILVEDPHWTKLTKINSNWSQDPLFFNYHKLGNKQKGVAGEHYVQTLMEVRGSEVTPPADPGHDRIIDGYKTEIKFSLAVSKGTDIIPDKFIINHVAVGKDWDRLIFCGINPLDSDSPRARIYFFAKEDFANYMSSGGNLIFKHQQSGKKGGNDDFICTDFVGFSSLPFVKDISQWRD